MTAQVAHAPFPPRRAARGGSWWAKAWARAVEEAAYGERELRRARALATQGRVGGISLAVGQVVAAVSEGPAWETVQVRLPTLDAAGSQAWVEAVGAEAGRIARLLDGDLPHDLVEHADELGAELLPYGGEFDATCSCDAWLDPCPHALAVLYQVGWILDDAPLALLHLRGLSRDELLARLHERTDHLHAVDDEDDALLDLALEAAHRARQLLADLDDESEE